MAQNKYFFIEYRAMNKQCLYLHGITRRERERKPKKKKKEFYT